MQREVYKTVQLRLQKGRDFPLELLSCPLLLELYLGRYPRLSLERGNWRWRCSRCGGPFEGTHMVVHTCRELNRPVGAAKEAWEAAPRSQPAAHPTAAARKDPLRPATL